MISLQQNIAEIQEKIANAPDNSYAIGVLIGSGIGYFRVSLIFLL